MFDLFDLLASAYLYYGGYHGIHSKDPGAGTELFIKSAKLGNQYAQCYLGFLYTHGLIKRNIKKAVKYTRLALEQGNVTARENLVYFYLHDYDRKNISLAEIIKLHQVDEKSNFSQINEGIMYYYGWGREQNKKKAQEILEKAGANDGSYHLALIHEENGRYKLAFELYRSIDKSGTVHYQEANGKLGYYYHHGLGCEADKEHALAHYFEDRNSPITQYNLAMFFENDPVKSKYWLELSAKGGYGPAIYNLALLEEENNLRKAIRLYKKLDDPYAQCNLANIYLKKRKIKEAVVLYKKSAKGGCKYACHNLSVIYEEGIDGVVKKSYRRAFKYMRLWMTSTLGKN